MSRICLFVCLLVFLVAVALAQDDNKHMVCRQIDSSNGNCDSARLTGPPGKKGPKGDQGNPGTNGITIKGEKGSPGSPAVSNTRQMAGFIADIKSLRSSLTKDEESLKEFKKFTMNAIRRVACDLEHNNVCYRVVWINKPFPDANRACKDIGYTPADIENVGAYNVVMEYLRSVMTGTFKFIYIGMTYNPQTSKVSLADGRPASFVKWDPGTPYKGSRSSAMLLVVRKDPKENSQGMWNAPPTYSPQGILCMS